MLDRHDINHVLLEDETGEIAAVYNFLLQNYPELEGSCGTRRRNALVKTMVHDFLDCWAVNWGDSPETIDRFAWAVEASETEVSQAFATLYQRAQDEHWPHSMHPYDGDETSRKWAEGELEAFDDRLVQLTRREGEFIYGCYAHDICWQILEPWLDKAIGLSGSCEQEAKWVLYRLTRESVEEVYSDRRIDLFLAVARAVAYPLLAGGLWFLVFHNLPMALILAGLIAITPLISLVFSIRSFVRVRCRRSGVSLEADYDLPLPEAAAEVRKETNAYRNISEKEGD